MDENALDITNPTTLVKIAKAADILQYMMNGATVKEACEMANVEYRTYRYWVENGIFAQLVTDRLQEIQAAADHSIVEKWGAMMNQVTNIALGIGEEVYARDQLAAVKLLYDLVIKPMAARTPKGTAEEKDFLDKKGDYDWVPRLVDGKILTITVQQTDATEPIEVTPLDY